MKKGKTIEEIYAENKKSVEELSNKEYLQIKKEVEDEINNSIIQEIAKYEKKKELNYNKNLQNMEKECNKLNEIFSI